MLPSCTRGVDEAGVWGCGVVFGGDESTAELEREDGSWNAPEQLLLSTNGNPSRCGKAIGPQRMAH